MYFFQMLLKIRRFQNLVILIHEQKEFPILYSKLYLNTKISPSILAMKNLNNNFQFYLLQVRVEDIYKEINQVNPRKTAPSTGIPVKDLKKNSDFFLTCMYVTSLMKP